MLIIHVQVEVARLLTAIVAGDFKLLIHLVGKWKYVTLLKMRVKILLDSQF